jgi:alpha-ketoglutarate-dependent taurine dioxygenase
MTCTITPLSDALGVEVTGVDLSGPVSREDVAAMEQALDAHLVMVVRDQHLTPAQYVAATRLFGDTMPQHLTDMLMKDHPEIAVLNSAETKTAPDGTFAPVGAREWHTDHTNHERPPKYTALYGVKLPKSGGDTGFANMQRAYEKLPADKQADLARHTVVTKIENREYVSAEDREKFGKPRTHPLVRTHPATGKKALYFHPGKVRNIEGMDEAESTEFVNGLLKLAIKPDVTYRHKWRPGDLVIWDNRAVLHIAHRDYDPAEGRVMHRILIEGEKPF